MHKILLFLILGFTLLFSAQIATVSGLDPNGDGFRSLRAKPKGKEIGKLYNGNDETYKNPRSLIVPKSCLN